MKKIRIRYLNDWPPEPGGSYEKGDNLRPSASEAVITRFQRSHDNKVVFTCTFGERKFSYDFVAENNEIAGQVAEVVKQSIGKSLEQIGDVEIELEQKR